MYSWHGPLDLACIADARIPSNHQLSGEQYEMIPAGHPRRGDEHEYDASAGI